MQISSQQAMAAPAFPLGCYLLATPSACLNHKTAFLLAQRRAFCQCLCAPGGSSPFVLTTRSSLSSRSDTRPSLQLHHLPLPSRGTWLQTPSLPTSIMLNSSRTKTEAGRPREDHIHPHCTDLALHLLWGQVDVLWSYIIGTGNSV